MPESNIPTEKLTDLQRKETIKKNLEKLRLRRENGELDPQDFHLENIYYINDEKYENRPLTRKDLGNQALVLPVKEFRQFGYITILLPNGEELNLLADDFGGNPDDPEDVLIIFPEDLGETKK